MTYVISIEMAKELSMVENNERGREARRWFIDCERKYKSAGLDIDDLLDNPEKTLSLLSGYATRLLEAKKTIGMQTAVIEQQAPKVEALERITHSEGNVLISDAAKSLGIHPLNKLFVWMSANGWIFRRGRHWVPFQPKIQQGLMELKVQTFEVRGIEQIKEQAKVTPKGLAKLAEIVAV